MVSTRSTPKSLSSSSFQRLHCTSENPETHAWLRHMKSHASHTCRFTLGCPHLGVPRIRCPREPDAAEEFPPNKYDWEPPDIREKLLNTPDASTTGPVVSPYYALIDGQATATEPQRIGARWSTSLTLRTKHTDRRSSPC